MSSNANKWWLIADETVTELQNRLNELSSDTVKALYPNVAKIARHALHQLETGLHTTEEIPEDFKEE